MTEIEKLQKQLTAAQESMTTETPLTMDDHQQAAIDQVAEILHDCFGCSPGGEASPGCECDPEPYESDAEHILTAATPHLRAGMAEEVRAIDIPEHRISKSPVISKKGDFE